MFDFLSCLECVSVGVLADGCDVWAVRRKVDGYDARPAYARALMPDRGCYWTLVQRTVPGRLGSMCFLSGQRFETFASARAAFVSAVSL